nr:Rabphilin-3A effector and C2 calcium-dependent membrane targeting domain containing protein [Haemonchus contortus]
MSLFRRFSEIFDREDQGDLMNDWEIGGTQNKWVCPSDRHLQLRAQLKSGWSVRTATARSPTNSKGNNGITEAEQEHIRQVLAKAEASRLKEQQRLGKMVDRLEKMRRRATGNGVTHCLLCHTEFGLLASKSYAAMCVDCRKYVCQRNCGVETLDTQRGEVIFLCKICSEAREVLWKKSGAWFYKEVPEFVRPEANGSVISPPPQRKPSWTSPAGSSTSLPYARRHLPPTPNERNKSPRPRIQPSWVKEKVMSSMSVDDDDRSSSEGEFAQSGVVRRNHKASLAARREENLARFALHATHISDSEEESSPDSRASTRSTSPRRSLATPSSYDSTHNQTAPPTHHDDAKSIDSGVVQSDHSNPQQAMTLSVSSLAPFSSPAADLPPLRRISQTELPPDVTKVTGSLSRTSLTTPPPIPPRTSPTAMTETRRSSPAPSVDMMSRKISISSAASTKRAGTSTDSVNVVEPIKAPPPRTESPTASFMSSPDDDSKSRTRRRAIITRFNSSPKQPPVSSLATTPATTEDSYADESTPPATTTHNSPDDDGSSAVSIASQRPGTLGSIQFTVLYNQEEKKLTVHLIRAKNLKAMDSNGFSDPYVKLHLLPGNAKATKLTSRTIEKTLNPEWNEELHYYGITESDKQKKTLRITVLDRDRIGSDFLGETRIALRKLPMNTLKKYNLYLEHAIPIQQPRQETDVIRGKLLLALQYNIQQGSLFVTIKRCAELIGMDSTGFSDPYCKVSLTPVTSKAHRQRTSIKKRTLNPEFNETLAFVVPFKDLPKKTLEIGVYDHDLGKHDDYIGGIVLSTAAKDERGKQWSSCIENPGQTFESWHQLELDG